MPQSMHRGLHEVTNLGVGARVARIRAASVPCRWRMQLGRKPPGDEQALDKSRKKILISPFAIFKKKKLI